ncbi:cytoskeleton protein RodZ [Mesocricetibacter intestinalis]|uniref:Cytoskeleton protein RodZ n=1 Tax=Mesocricetibacter intestinalis TaxID=1521930 RepID=A0A4V3D9Z9_9PAST|nr:RodZ family helix-turn-helix domain-containing protein [Mesocricetibacter intestinalis]TDQ59513.1 cytoskeleton protein RodZ [Mesocricetibacter intestinalis]
MNTETAPEHTELTLGQQFRRARENLNLSVEDIAAELNLRPAVLRAIEQDELIQKTIAPTFMKGYLRSYARFLKLPDSLWAKEAAALDASQPVELHKKYTTPKVLNTASHGRWIGYLSLIVLLFVLGMTALWWWENYQQSNNERDNLVQNYVATENTESGDNKLISTTQDQDKAESGLENPSAELPLTPHSSAAEFPAAEDNVAPTQNESTGGANPAQAMLIQHSAQPDTVSAEGNPATQNSEPEQSAPMLQGDLQIEVKGNCWISVKDANNRVLAQKEYRRGETLSFNQGAPYSLIIGAPGNVKITYKGEAYPLKIDGRVAKFKLQ